MREIKFRGKTLNSKKLIYGGYCKDASGYDCILLPIKGGHVFEPVIPESVGQYTGLKDKNGKEIYEGDIIQRYNEGKKVETIVANMPYIYFEKWVCFGEIIGNIYENSELLKV